MFTNIGTKIKVLAKIVFIFGVIGGFILACGIWSSMSDNAGQNVGIFFSGLFAFAAVFVASWVGVFLLYGFGELIDSNEKCEYYLSRLQGETNSRFLERLTDSADKHSESGWLCECGTRNRIGSSYCKICGKKKE